MQYTYDIIFWHENDNNHIYHANNLLKSYEYLWYFRSEVMFSGGVINDVCLRKTSRDSVCLGLPWPVANTGSRKPMTTTKTIVAKNLTREDDDVIHVETMTSAISDIHLAEDKRIDWLLIKVGKHAQTRTRIQAHTHTHTTHMDRWDIICLRTKSRYSGLSSRWVDRMV